MGLSNAKRNARPGRFVRKGFLEPERKLDAEEAARLKEKQAIIASGKFADDSEDDFPGKWSGAMPKQAA